MDDIFCIFDTNSNVERFFEFLNSQHQNLKFTIEREYNQTLSFLDVEINQKDDKFQTSIFRKKTFTGLLLNFSAICPIQWKKGLITCLLHRAYIVCSSWSLFNDEIEKIRKFMSINGYPNCFFDKIVQKFLDKKFKNSGLNDSEKKIPKNTF